MGAAIRLVEAQSPGLAEEMPARLPRVSTRRVTLQAATVLLDIWAICSGIGLSVLVTAKPAMLLQAPQLLMVMVPVFLLAAANGSAYGPAVLVSWRLGVRCASSALALSALAVIGMAFAFKLSADYSRVMIALSYAFAFVMMAASRALAVHATTGVLDGGILDEVVICDAMPPPPGRRRVIDALRLGLSPRLDCPAMLDRLSRHLGHPDRVMIACPPARREPWSAMLKGFGIDVEVLMPELEPLGILQARTCTGGLAALVTRGPLGLRDRILKRGFDLLVVLIVVPALLLIAAIVALLIKLDDGGPVLFAQQRVGRGNRQFAIYKFRSMRAAEADRAGALSTCRDDRRITRIGRLLRATSLDELPQLLNVLKGDMSIVGPRPHALGSTAGDKLFWAVDARYWLRHAAKPGLTGLAQVRGFRGATMSEDDLINRVQADLEYMSGWSLWRDLRILAATVKVVAHPNAF